MAGGYKLRRGEIRNYNVSDDRLWSLFNFVFSNASIKINTYKFGLVKAILDNIFNGKETSEGLLITYTEIFTRYAENYWNLVVKYNLKQMRPHRYELSSLERIFMEAVSDNGLIKTLEFDSIEEKTRNRIISKLSRSCRDNVFGALYEDLDGSVYSFDLTGPGLIISPRAYEFLLKYKITLERLNYFAWAKFLEKINEPEDLIGVIDKLELATPKRNNLSIYRDILLNEFEDGCHCFYCGKKLSRDIDVDHFIPWSFVKDDKLWNFVLACPHCNRSKHDRLPAKTLIPRIEERNKKIILLDDPVVKKDMESYSDDIIPKMWNYADMSGFRPYDQIMS